MDAIGKVTAVIGAFFDAYSMGSNANEYINLWYDVPYCSCFRKEQKNYRIKFFLRV